MQNLSLNIFFWKVSYVLICKHKLAHRHTDILISLFRQNPGWWALSIWVFCDPKIHVFGHYSQFFFSSWYSCNNFSWDTNLIRSSIFVRHRKSASFCSTGFLLMSQNQWPFHKWTNHDVLFYGCTSDSNVRSIEVNEESWQTCIQKDGCLLCIFLFKVLCIVRTSLHVWITPWALILEFQNG